MDLQILKILTNNCRTSYRNIGKALGISANTARTRINNLILRRAIEQFFTIVNFSLVGYNEVLTIILKVNKIRYNVIDKVDKITRGCGPIYMHIEIFDGVYVFGIAVKNGYATNNNPDSLRKNFSKVFGKSISVIDVFFWQAYFISIREIPFT